MRRAAALHGQPGACYLQPYLIIEGHPFMYVFDLEGTDELRVSQPYFGGPEPRRWAADGSYADPSASVSNPSHEWQHPLGEIVSALGDAGLVVEYLHEFPIRSWAPFPFLKRGPDGWWRLPDGYPSIPLTFSLKARKPV